MSFRLTIILTFLLIVVSGPSFANVGADAGDTIYNYTREYPSGSSGAGDLTYISLSYDIEQDELTGAFSLVERNNRLADTAWMVLSPGRNPKGAEGDHGIMYMDFNTGNSWLYQYNGRNDPTSYRNSALLGFYQNSLTVDGDDSTRVVNFNYDLSTITAPNSSWTGMSFGERVGVWFHGLEGDFVADENGIVSYDSTSRGQFWHDTSNSTTVSVPEIDSAGLPLAAMLLLSLLAIFRERSGQPLI